MRILITNTILATRTGTEVFVAQLADALRSREHEVILYSPLIGGLGLELRGRGHLVFDRIANVAQTPDVIHAHHVGPTLTALAAFPNTPAIFVMHSVDAEFDAPPLHPQIVSYHAVSSFVRAQRASAALPASAIKILSNAVDLERFPLKPEISKRAKRALLVAKDNAGKELVQATCLRLGLSIDAVGPGTGRVTSDLASAFLNADIVFASGRSALEALASGCAVILTDGGRFGGLVQPATLEDQLELNLGVRAMPHRVSVSMLESAIGSYDACNTLDVAHRVREQRSLEAQVDALLTVYGKAIVQGGRSANLDRQLATLIEAYVPSHGDLPWRELAHCIADGSLKSKLEWLSETNRFAMVDERSPMTAGLHCFRRGDPACSWLRTGWWEPEDWGVWSQETASLSVPIAPDVAKVTVHYQLFGPSIDTDHPPSLQIIPGEKEFVLAKTQASTTGVRVLTFDIPAPAQSVLSLTFTTPRAKSPAEVGSSSDYRPLGVGLISLTAHTAKNSQRLRPWLRR